MNNLVNKGAKWGKKALMLKLGKAAIKRGGLVGVGIGAVAGAGYYAYNLYEKRKKAAAEEEARRSNIRRIDNIDDNHSSVEGEKTIVI